MYKMVHHLCMGVFTLIVFTIELPTGYANDVFVFGIDTATRLFMTAATPGPQEENEATKIVMEDVFSSTTLLSTSAVPLTRRMSPATAATQDGTRNAYDTVVSPSPMKSPMGSFNFAEIMQSGRGHHTESGQYSLGSYAQLLQQKMNAAASTKDGVKDDKQLTTNITGTLDPSIVAGALGLETEKPRKSDQSSILSLEELLGKIQNSSDYVNAIRDQDVGPVGVWRSAAVKIQDERQSSKVYV